MKKLGIRNKDTEEMNENLKSIYYDDERIANNSGGTYYSIYSLDRQKNDVISGNFGRYYGAT